MAGTLWVISDTHFGHTNIIGHCDRPYVSVQEMNADMMTKWNARVKKGDTIIHVGDFAFTIDEDEIRTTLEQLNGYKILVRGNHDKSKTKMARLGFDIVVDKLAINDVMFVHSPPPFNYNNPEQKIIYGHVHNNSHARPSRKCYNACVELHDYEPQLFYNIKYSHR